MVHYVTIADSWLDSEFLNGVQIVFFNRKAKDVDVVPDMIEVGRPRQNDNVLLHEPL